MMNQGWMMLLCSAGLFAAGCGDGTDPATTGPAAEDEDGPYDLPEDAALKDGEVELFSAPGGPGDCLASSTPAASVPWVSQKLGSIRSWSHNMCCGPAVITMARGVSEHRAVSEDDLKATIDWMSANLGGWKKNDYRCQGTSSGRVLSTLRNYLGVSARAISTDWCSLASLLDGLHTVIFQGDTQGSNRTETFQAGASHWLILERVDGGYAYVDDPGRTLAAQGDSRRFTVESVKRSFEGRGGLALVVDTGCEPRCDGKDCGADGGGGICGACGAGFTCDGGACIDDVPASCTYSMTTFACPNASPATGTGPGGGEIFSACGAVDAGGAVTIHATKFDGSTFADRPYQIRVSPATSDPCGPSTEYAVSSSAPAGIGTKALTFTFPSVFLADQKEKAYCVTASTKPGDQGYDPTIAAQRSWWYSRKVEMARVCP